ncbi:MAG: tyrosine-type recombinase/integrase [archaeon]
MKLDPYKHKERYNTWKENVVKLGEIPNVGKTNSELILNYLYDMERGINIASKSVKGSRSFIRLNTIRDKMGFFSVKFKQIYGLEKVIDVTEEQLVGFFVEMKQGQLKKEDGKNYFSVDSYAKIFKAFWHWWMKVNKKKGIEIQDITTDLDTKQEKPDWVYLNEQEVRLIADNSKRYYKVLIMFLFDTGIRAPTELMNIKVSDFFNDFKELNIREEISKTFGRRIKLMLSSSMIKEHIQLNKLESDDFIFTKSPSAVNRYFGEMGEKLFGDKVSPAGQKYSELTMYDFRHNACCYWLPRYKSESALKYRFGWKKSDKIHYYSELLGMKDTIAQEDLLIDTTKTEIEQDLQKVNKENDLLKERMSSMEKQIVSLMESTNKLLMETVGKI